MNFRCEDRIKPLLDGLLAYKQMIDGDQLYRPTAKRIREWVSGAVEYVAEMESWNIPEARWIDCMDYGFRKHNSNMLRSGNDPTVKSHRTIEYLVDPFAKKMPKHEDFFEAVEEDEDVVLCNTCGKEVVNYNDDGVCADCQMRSE